MLKLMRNKELKKKVIWFVSIIIIISFGFFGTAYLITDSVNSRGAGKIFGKKISHPDFEKAYNEARIQAILRYGENFENIKQYLDLKTQAWDRLILLHEAKKMRINVSNQEIIDTIAQYPFFQRNNQFDTLLYNDILRYVFRVSARDFEESTRDSIRITKIFDSITNDITVTNEEVLESFKVKNEKIKTSYAIFNPGSYLKDISVTDTEVSEYFNANKLDFIIPLSINAEYVFIPFTAEITEENKELLRQKAYDLFALAQTNNKFIDAAKKYEINLKTTGFFDVENPPLTLKWPLDILEKSLNLEMNIVSEPIETESGIYLVRIVEKKESYIPEFNEVTNKVKDALIRSKAMDIAKENANQAFKVVQEAYKNNASLSNQEILNLITKAPKTTPLFSRGEYIENVGVDPEFEKTAFSLSNDNRLSEIIKNQNGYYILLFEELIEASTEEFENQKETLTKELLNQTKISAFNQFLTQLRIKAELIDNMSR